MDNIAEIVAVLGIILLGYVLWSLLNSSDGTGFGSGCLNIWNAAPVIASMASGSPPVILAWKHVFHPGAGGTRIVGFNLWNDGINFTARVAESVGDRERTIRTIVEKDASSILADLREVYETYSPIELVIKSSSVILVNGKSACVSL